MHSSKNVALKVFFSEEEKASVFEGGQEGVSKIWQTKANSATVRNFPSLFENKNTMFKNVIPVFGIKRSKLGSKLCRGVNFLWIRQQKLLRF